jgi:ribosomal protein S18 acetylase RimI-like enzyme
MHKYAEYLKLHGKSLIEVDEGYATYMELNDGMYIQDIYVRPEHRNEGVASKMADMIAMIAKSKGLKKLYGTVKPSFQYSTESMKILLAYGFRINSSAIDAIALEKEI